MKKIVTLNDNDIKKKGRDKSKIIKMNTKSKSKEKKQIQQTLAKNAARKTEKEITSNGSATTHVHKHKNKDRNIPIEVKSNDLSERALANIEKKKAKKLAKKLRKKDPNKANTAENQKCDVTKEVVVKSLVKGKTSAKTNPNNKILGDKPSGEEPSKYRDTAREEATVFVGNLPVNTKRVQILRLFSDYAPVNSMRFRTACGKTIFKHKQRKEAGSLNAWIVLKDSETAKRALSLNGTLFKSNYLRVTSSQLNSSSMDVKRTIFVGNLKYSANEKKLREIFSTCGDIDYIRCLQDEKGCKGVAYVCFKTPEAVGLALDLNETMLDERPINVERYSLRKLGAKKARETTETENKKSVDGRKNHKTKNLKDAGKEDSNAKKMEKTSKKSKFRGVKVDGMKKKKKQKKVTNQMQKLAQKIAPRKP